MVCAVQTHHKIRYGSHVDKVRFFACSVNVASGTQVLRGAPRSGLASQSQQHTPPAAVEFWDDPVEQNFPKMPDVKTKIMWFFFSLPVTWLLLVFSFYQPTWWADFPVSLVLKQLIITPCWHSGWATARHFLHFTAIFPKRILFPHGEQVSGRMTCKVRGPFVIWISYRTCENHQDICSVVFYITQHCSENLFILAVYFIHSPGVSSEWQRNEGHDMSDSRCFHAVPLHQQITKNQIF